MKKKTTEVSKVESATVQQYNQEQIDLIKNTVAKGSTDNELALFLQIAKRSNLDPFTRQIHFIKRRQKNKDGGYDEVGTIVTGIDGYRAIAVRSGELAGIDDAIFDTETESNPKKATVTVHRLVAGVSRPFTASARWNEYVQQYFDKEKKVWVPAGQWAKMPYLMLGKVAEALALRKAFPNDLSGLYTADEMNTHDEPQEAASIVQPLPETEVKSIESQEILRQKARISSLLNILCAPGTLNSPADFMTNAERLTGGLILRPENYAEIINRLEILVEEKNAKAY